METQQHKFSFSDKSDYNAFICSFAFFLVFSAFGTVQTYATSSHGDDGAISLAILYIVLTFSNIFIPKIASYVSPRWAMFLGSATYAIYVGANIHEIRGILFAAAALEGLGAALLWVAQGSFITKCSLEWEAAHPHVTDSQLGWYNGLFWAWMVANQFVGNSLAALLFYFDISTTIVYIVFTSINVFGVCVFLLIKPFDSDRETNKVQKREERNVSIQSSENYAIQNEDDLSANKMDKSQHSDQRTKTISDIDTIPFIHSNKNDQQNNEQQQIGVPTVSIFGMLSLWLDKRQLLLIPFTLYSGISQAFEYGNFPAQINDNFHKFGAMAVFGGVDAFCSLLFGRLSDKIGRLPVLGIAFFAHGVVYVYFYLYWHIENGQQPKDVDQIQDEDWYIFFILAAFLGIGDAGFNTQLYALYGILLGEKAEVFANLKFWQSLAMTWGFLSSGVHEDWNIVLISCFALLVTAAVPLYLFLPCMIQDHCCCCTIGRKRRHQLSF